MKNGAEKWVVAAFRTDGYYQVNGGFIPTIQHLEQNYQLVGETEVPDDIVEFAVQSEKRRQESVGDIGDLLKEAITSGDPEGGFRGFLALLEHERMEEEDPDAEERAGEAINRLLTRTGGLV